MGRPPSAPPSHAPPSPSSSPSCGDCGKECRRRGRHQQLEPGSGYHLLAKGQPGQPQCQKFLSSLPVLHVTTSCHGCHDDHAPSPSPDHRPLAEGEEEQEQEQERLRVT